MDEIRFADGFDVPERLVFGLGAAQLLVLVAGLLLCYAVLHAPIPAALAAPLVVCVGIPAVALAWLRFGGRPAIEWALFALRYASAPRAGAMHLSAPAPATASRPAAVATPAPAPDDAVEPEPGLGTNVIPLRLYAVRESGGVAAPGAPEPRSPTHPLRAAGAHRVTFFSCRGGSGRTTLAAELACLLAAGGSPSQRRRAPRVALLDLDVERATVGPRLGADARTILDYALAHPDERRLTDFLWRHPSGAQLLAGPARPPATEWPLTPGVVREILRELDLEGFDVVISDVSAQLSPITRAALLSSDDVLVVVVPTSAGVQDAYRSTETLRRVGVRRLRYVVNRMKGAADLGDMLTDLGGRVVAEIPDDAAFDDAEQRHRLVAHGGSAADIPLQRLAASVASELLVPCAR